MIAAKIVRLLRRAVGRSACVVALLASAAVLPASAATLRTGAEAPLFTLQDLSGAEVALADLAGPARRPGSNGVIIVFFATWCPPCRRELPIIDAMVDGLGQRGISVLLVGHGEDRGRLAPFLAKLGVSRATALADPSGGTVKRYGVRILPTIVAVTAGGTVGDLLLGETRDVEGEFSRLADLLAGSPAVSPR